MASGGNKKKEKAKKEAIEGTKEFSDEGDEENLPGHFEKVVSLQDKGTEINCEDDEDSHLHCWQWHLSERVPQIKP